MPIAAEELAWGDAGIALAILGSTLGLAGIAGNGTPEQLMEWGPQCFGTPEKIQLAAFAVSEPDAGSDVSSLRTRAVYDEAKDEWVLNGTKTWITNGGIADIHVVVASVDPELGSRGQASFIVPAQHPGPLPGPEVPEDGHPGLAHRRGRPRRLPGPGPLPARWQGQARRALARAREGKKSGSQAAMKTFEGSRPTVGAQALGIARAAYEYSLEYAKERKAFGRAIIENQAIAFKLADMKTRIDASRLLVWRASWMGAQRQGVHLGRGLDVQALRRGDRRLRDRGGHPDPGRLRLRPRVPGRAVAPRLEDLHHLRGHQRDPAADHRPGHLRGAHQVAELGFSLRIGQGVLSAPVKVSGARIGVNRRQRSESLDESEHLLERSNDLA